eukprot:g16838.t1
MVTQDESRHARDPLAKAPPKVKAVLKAEPKTKWKGRAGTKVRMDQWKKSLKGCWLETLEFDFDEVNLEPTERVEVDGDNVDESWEVGDDILDVAQLEIDTENFGELRLTETAITKVQAGLKLLIETVGSVEAAGDAIYSTLFEAAPSDWD